MNTKIKDFSFLNKEEKIKKLKNMLEVFNGGNNIFSEIYELFIELGDNISDDFLVNIYSIIIETIDNLTDENISDSINKLEDIKIKFLQIKKQEEEEKIQELLENENLLKQI